MGLDLEFPERRRKIFHLSEGEVLALILLQASAQRFVWNSVSWRLIWLVSRLMFRLI